MIVDPRLVKKILVIKLRAIGDVLLSTVVLESLRSGFPDASIDFLTERPSREVIEGNPCVNSAVIFDGKKQSGLGLILDIRRRRYDLVIDLFGNPRSALVALGSGARYRVGYRFGWRRYCYNIITEPRGNKVHNTEFNLDAVRRLGIPVVSSSPHFPLTRKANDFAEAFFSDRGLKGKFVVALNPGGGWPSKRWPIRHFAQLGDQLTEKYGAKILVVWGPGEEGRAAEIQKSMRARPDLIPPSNLKQLGAILKRCNLIVTNDSGPMHIAAAVGTAVVAIFGPTNPEFQGPVTERRAIIQNQDLLCLGCNFTHCPIGNPCMEKLGADVVKRELDRLLAISTGIQVVRSP
jgi:lipopolysaccharide heptosyltransferase II